MVLLLESDIVNLFPVTDGMTVSATVQWARGAYSGGFITITMQDSSTSWKVISQQVWLLLYKVISVAHVVSSSRSDKVRRLERGNSFRIMLWSESWRQLVSHCITRIDSIAQDPTVRLAVSEG